MRKTITLLTLLMVQISFAQIDCPDFTPDDSGDLLYLPAGSQVINESINLPEAYVNQPYEEYLQFHVPDQLDFNLTSQQLNRITINSVDNLPEGINYQCSTDNCILLANQSGCIQLSGIPQETGTFNLSITATSWVIWYTNLGIFSSTNTIYIDVPYNGGYSDLNQINSIIPNITLVIQEVPGCTDSSACNYDENATDDDGSCYMISVSVENYSYNHQMVMVSTDAVEATYVWYYGENVLMNSSSDMMIPKENGEYSVIVTDNHGCSVTIDFIVAELGLFDLEDSGIKLYPNPATDKLYLEANNTSNELNIEVVNVIGEVVLVPKNIQSGDIIEFNIEDLSSGIYYIKVSSNQDFVTIP